MTSPQQRRRERKWFFVACLLALLVAVVSECEYIRHGGPEEAIRPGPAGPERTKNLQDIERTPA